MKYILANKAKASAQGLIVRHHITWKSSVVLNEKEVLCALKLSAAATLEEKAALLDGTVYNNSTEILNAINK